MFVLFAPTCAGAQSTLYFSFPVTTSSNWVSFSVPLVESAGWKFGAPDGPSATQAQFQATLGSLDALRIEFVGNYPTVFIDNISLGGLITSSFDGCTADGWTTPASRTIHCVIGNPPPSIGSEASSRAGFESPGKFLGNQSAAYGKSLSFDKNDGFNDSVVTNCIITLIEAQRQARRGHPPFSNGAVMISDGEGSCRSDECG